MFAISLFRASCWSSFAFARERTPSDLWPGCGSPAMAIAGHDEHVVFDRELEVEGDENLTVPASCDFQLGRRRCNRVLLSLTLPGKPRRITVEPVKLPEPQREPKRAEPTEPAPSREPVEPAREPGRVPVAP